MTPLRIWPGMSFGYFLNQEVTDEEWVALFDPPPVAEPQNFIGPRVYPPKYLRCQGCDEWVKVPDKYRRAKKAWCGCCRP